jgi:hypothetical protein
VTTSLAAVSPVGACRICQVSRATFLADGGGSIDGVDYADFGAAVSAPCPLQKLYRGVPAMQARTIGMTAIYSLEATSSVHRGNCEGFIAPDAAPAERMWSGPPTRFGWTRATAALELIEPFYAPGGRYVIDLPRAR